jgi:VanZ family protein
MSASAAQMQRLLRQKTLRFPRLWWAAGWALLLFILISTLEPPRYVPDLHVSDKLEHAGAFFLLTFWFGGLLERRHYPAMALGMLILGASIEVAQGAMGWGRTEDVWDFVADSEGVLLAAVCIYAGLGLWMVQVERLLGLSPKPI